MKTKNPNTSQEICECGHLIKKHIINGLYEPNMDCSVKNCSCKKFVPQKPKEFLSGIHTQARQTKPYGVAKPVSGKAEPTIGSVKNSQKDKTAENNHSQRNSERQGLTPVTDTRKGSDDEILRESLKGYKQGSMFFYVNLMHVTEKAISLTRQAEQKKILDLIDDVLKSSPDKYIDGDDIIAVMNEDKKGNWINLRELKQKIKEMEGTK